jgi:hypothetical protein
MCAFRSSSVEADLAAIDRWVADYIASFVPAVLDGDGKDFDASLRKPSSQEALSRFASEAQTWVLIIEKKTGVCVAVNLMFGIQ